MQEIVMQCPKCNKEIPALQSQCPSCSGVPGENVPPQKQTEASTSQSETCKPAKSTRNKRWLKKISNWGCSILVTAVLILIFGPSLVKFYKESGGEQIVRYFVNRATIVAARETYEKARQPTLLKEKQSYKVPKGERLLIPLPVIGEPTQVTISFTVMNDGIIDLALMSKTEDEQYSSTPGLNYFQILKDTHYIAGNKGEISPIIDKGDYVIVLDNTDIGLAKLASDNSEPVAVVEVEVVRYGAW